MLTEDREYHYIGELILKRSQFLNDEYQPKDDKVNWLFFKIEERLFSFIYKIEEPINAKNEKVFNAKMSFMLTNEVKKLIKLNQTYLVLRGPECIGEVKMTSLLI